MILCDFCSSPVVAYSYPCRDFTIPGTPAASVGAWAACEACARLIDADQRDALALRACRLANRSLLFGYAPLSGLAGENELVACLRELHGWFFAHRTGEKRPVTLN